MVNANLTHWLCAEVKNIPVGVHSPSQLHGLRTKLVELGQQYCRSERYFPLAYLIQLLEQTGAQLEWDPGFVHQTLLEVGVAITALFGVYDRLFKAKVCVCYSGYSTDICTGSHVLPLCVCRIHSGRQLESLFIS